MPSLPTVGGSDGTWGTTLNTFLQVSHNADGTLKFTVGPDYTTTNVTTTRTIDADTATQNQIADVLCTLINDLVAAGILT